MIRKLRIKFIAISMTSTIIVLFLILGSINLLNYREMSHNADTILDFLKENDGEISINLNIKRQMEYHQKLPLSPAIFLYF